MASRPPHKPSQPPSPPSSSARPAADDASARLAAMMMGHTEEPPAPSAAPSALTPAATPEAGASDLSDTPIAPIPSRTIVEPEPAGFGASSFGAGYVEAAAPAFGGPSPASSSRRHSPPPPDIRQTLSPPLIIFGLLLVLTTIICFSLSDDHALGALPRYVPVLAGLLGALMLMAGGLLVAQSNKTT